MESAVPSVALVSSMVTLAVLISVYHRVRWRYIKCAPVKHLEPRMKTELFTPAALLAQTALKDWHERWGELPPEEMTKAFVQAYRALEKAQQLLAQPASS